MNNKNNIIHLFIILIILMVMSIGLSFAYFTANLTGVEDSTTITVTGGLMEIHYDGGPNINIFNIIPSNDPVATKILL